MPDGGKYDSLAGVEPRATVKTADIDGIASALGMELVEESEPTESPDDPSELRKVLGILAGIYPGVQEVTERDIRGR